jgi:two-component system nitrate/nitrite response regulator NarL
MREGLRKLLMDASFLVSGEASNTEDALSLIEAHQDERVDFVIVEGALLNNDTSLWFDTIRFALPEARIMILTHETDISQIGQTSIAAADCILSFEISGEALIQSLRLIQPGHGAAPRDLVMLVLCRDRREHAAARPLAVVDAMSYPDHAPSYRRAEEDLPAPRVSDEQQPSNRETEILQCLLQGYSNKVIARQLGITEATVKVHLKGLLRKIRATNRTQAAIWALSNGYCVGELGKPNERMTPAPLVASSVG